MTVVYGKFEMTEKISVKEANSTQGTFIAEPFERGFGHTLGNSLRRVILNCIEAPAIVSIGIEGIPHEYMAVEGILEDVTNIILNLKGALLRKIPIEGEKKPRGYNKISTVLDITEEILKENDGQYSVTLKDIIKDQSYEIVNPDHHLFSVTKPMKKRVDLKIAIGRGYVPSERHVIDDKVAGEIVLDSIFSPVTMVNYYVENTRVGQDTDFDKLILEIKTDGRITPQESLSFASLIIINHFEAFKNLDSYTLTYEEAVVEEDTDRDEILKKLCLRINEIELSVRSTNCLSSANIQTIGELVVKPEPEMLKYRNFGKKSLNEIKDKLFEMSLSLGMDLSRYSINAENIQDVLRQYEEEKKNS